MSLFHFGVHRFRLTGGGDAYQEGGPEHIMSIDHNPLGESPDRRIHVERDPQHPDRFRISATLDNDQMQNFSYSASVWCGDARVCEIHNREATALPGQWFPVCTVDLRESLSRREGLGKDAYLRVHLNVSVEEAVDEPYEDEPYEPWKRRHRQEPRVIRGERRANTATDKAIWCLLWAVFAGKIVCGIP